MLWEIEGKRYRVFGPDDLSLAFLDEVEDNVMPVGDLLDAVEQMEKIPAEQAIRDRTMRRALGVLIWGTRRQHDPGITYEEAIAFKWSTFRALPEPGDRKAPEAPDPQRPRRSRAASGQGAAPRRARAATPSATSVSPSGSTS